MGILRALRRGNILQNNAVQTAAASGEGLAAGVDLHAARARSSLGSVWTRFSYVETTLIAGVRRHPRRAVHDPAAPRADHRSAAAVPRGRRDRRGAQGRRRRRRWRRRARAHRAWSARSSRSARPGSSCGPRSSSSAAWLTGGAATAATATAAAAKAGAPFYFGINASPALLSVGYIVGFNVAAVIFAGAVLNRWIAVPLFSMFGDSRSSVMHRSGHAHHARRDAARRPARARSTPPTSIHKYVTRYLGVGGMLVGGVWSLYKLRKSLLGGDHRRPRRVPQAPRGRRRGDRAHRARHADEHHPDPDRRRRSCRCSSSSGTSRTRRGISAVMAIVMVIAGFLFSAVASYMAGLVGSSNNPVSGITISTILVSRAAAARHGPARARPARSRRS